MNFIRYKYIVTLLCVIISLLLTSCGDNNDEPTVNNISGTWVLTHFSYQHHYYQNGIWWDDTDEKEVTAFQMSDISGADLGKWWDYLTFNNGNATIGLLQYRLPTQPTASQFDQDTPEGQIAYMEAMENWYESIDCQTGDFPFICPFSLKGDKLYMGTMYQGNVSFSSPDTFSLTYQNDNFETKGEYKTYILTFKRNS